MRTKRKLKSTTEYATRAFSCCLFMNLFIVHRDLFCKLPGRVYIVVVIGTYIHVRKLRNFMVYILVGRR